MPPMKIQETLHCQSCHELEFINQCQVLLSQPTKLNTPCPIAQMGSNTWHVSMCTDHCVQSSDLLQLQNMIWHWTLKIHLLSAPQNPTEAPAQNQEAQQTSSVAGTLFHLIPRTRSSEEERKYSCISFIALEENSSGQYSKSCISKLAQHRKKLFVA